MSRTTEVATEGPFVGRDEALSVHPRGEYHKEQAANPDVVI